MTGELVCWLTSLLELLLGYHNMTCDLRLTIQATATVATGTGTLIVVTVVLPLVAVPPRPVGTGTTAMPVTPVAPTASMIVVARSRPAATIVITRPAPSHPPLRPRRTASASGRQSRRRMATGTTTLMVARTRGRGGRTKARGDGVYPRALFGCRGAVQRRSFPHDSLPICSSFSDDIYAKTDCYVLAGMQLVLCALRLLSNGPSRRDV
jgi:hypothetical protein